MSSDFFEDFDPNEQVNVTMINIIEKSLDALRTKMSKSSPPASKEFQWWADTDTGILKMRSEGGASWQEVYDFTKSQIILRDQQITSDKINNLARKPLLVDQQIINPSQCLLRYKFKAVSIFGTPNELFSTVTNLGKIPRGNRWETLLTSKIYIPSDAGKLYIRAKQETCNMQFIVGSSTSSPTGDVTGPAWGTSAILDLSSKSGWEDIVVQGYSTIAFSDPDGYGGIQGISSRWEVSE